MRRRVLAASGGGMVGAVLLCTVLALSPARPSGLAVGLVIIGVLVPGTAGAGARLALAAAGEDDSEVAGRLAAMSAPVTVLLTLFVLNLAFGLDHLGAQQIVATVIGVTAAGAIAARFSDPASPEG